jgi:hypothetical protein
LAGIQRLPDLQGRSETSHFLRRFVEYYRSSRRQFDQRQKSNRVIDAVTIIRGRPSHRFIGVLIGSLRIFLAVLLPYFDQ